MLFLAIVVILTVVSPPTSSASQGDNTTLPFLLPARVISHNQQAVCPPDEVQETATNETTQDIWNSIHNIILPTVLFSCWSNPGQPCSLLQWNPHKLLLWILMCKELQWNCCAGVLWHWEGVWLQQHKVDTCSQSNYNSPDAFGQHGGCTHRLHAQTKEGP